MAEDLEHILSQLSQPDNAVIQQATAQLKQAFKDPAIVLALCTVVIGSTNPEIRQSASVMLRLRVKNHWKKMNPNDKESLKGVVLQAFMQESEHFVQHSLSQLCAVIVKHETPDCWPALMQFLTGSTKSSNPHDRQVGLLLLSKVLESNPEPFKPHYTQLLQLFSSVLQDHNNPTALYYCILTLTTMTPYMGTEELMRSVIPKLIIALKHLIKANQDQACEAMEVFIELFESEVSIIVPHIAEIVDFCLEVGSDTELSDSLRVKTLSSLAFLIKLKSKTVLKQKLVSRILQAVFPLLVAEPPPGEQDPEDQDDNDYNMENNNPKNCAAQIIDTMALHMPPEKLFQHIMPLTQKCLASENPYQKKGGLICLAVLAEGCADHIRTKMLSSVLLPVCQSLSDSNEVVRSAGLFALGQLSEHLQPDVSQYCADLMPMLLNYLSSLSQAKISHVTKAFYALENFMENLVTITFFLKGFLTSETEEMRPLQTQSLDTLSVLARTIGKDVFSPLASECVQLGLNLTDTIDDPDLRRCTYSLYSAVSTVNPDCLTPHLTAITTIMLLALKSNEGITAHLEEDKTFVLLDDDDDDDDEEETDMENLLEDDTEADLQDVAGFSVENAYTDEKVDACEALGEIAFNTGAAFQPFLESIFLQVYEMRDYPHDDVRQAAFGAMGQFCRAQHQAWKDSPTEANHQALLKLLEVVIPCFVENVRKDHERQVVMGILETMNSVIKSCKEAVFINPAHLKEVSHVIRDVLKKKTVCQDGSCDESDGEEQQAEYDAMLLEFAGEGIPLVAAAVPADNFAPFLNDLLPLIMSKAKSSCTVAERSFSVGTISEILQALATVSGGRQVAGRLSTRLLPVLVAGVKDSDAEVRNNSVFGLGCLAEAAGPIVKSDYPTMLSVFSNMLTKESDLRVIDNLCAALCRMILSNFESVPLEQVLPALVARLPLKADMEENKTVYSCLTMLYNKSPQLVLHNIIHPGFFCQSLIFLCLELIVAMLMKLFSQQHEADFHATLTSLSEEQQAKIGAAISAS
uniref:Importin 4 n=1 Tax=Takifugu rubripes TaxID=31033 RepID=A0A674NIH0_TAKRU